MSKDFFKEARDKVKKKLDEEAAATPEAEEEESLADEEMEDGSEAVPDENVENLDVPSEDGATAAEAGVEDGATTGDSPNGSTEGAVDIEAVMAENAQMKEKIASLEKALEQSGELSKEGITAAAMGGLDDLDFSTFVYGTEEEKGKARNSLVAYLLEALKTDAAPILAERADAERQNDIQKAIKLLSSMEEEFPGYGTKSDAIEALIGRDDVLKAYENPVQARIAAYIMNEGLESIKKGNAEMTLDELMDLYRKNEEFKAAVEQDRLDKLKATGELPVVPMGGSFSQAEPYKAEKKPQTMAEAREKMKKKFFG